MAPKRYLVWHHRTSTLSYMVEAKSCRDAVSKVQNGEGTLLPPEQESTKLECAGRYLTPQEAAETVKPKQQDLSDAHLNDVRFGGTLDETGE